MVLLIDFVIFLLKLTLSNSIFFCCFALECDDFHIGSGVGVKQVLFVK